MEKSKKIKSSLVFGAISMMLCMIILVGSTFAWLTDRVTTGRNSIMTGNLDVELYSRDAEGNYNPVSETESLFNDAALWEPGHTEVVYLKVSNLGTLGVKYKLSVNVVAEEGGTNIYGNNFKLSDYLVFGAVFGTEETVFDNREAAQEAVGGMTGINEYTREGVLTSNSDGYIALVVYMPPTIGNDANYMAGSQAPSVDLGVTLVATQYALEADSFDAQYDADSEFSEPSGTDESEPNGSEEQTEVIE